ncbi:hypothetical protein [Phenylobacterium sp.]|uniref:hypothetical protein n=1 Tax=Phenylobacterium sp. TaxID=1871053 RepID=UPI0025CE8152|nr:hypothetical protein [Phenylobacterium sp.]
MAMVPISWETLSRIALRAQELKLPVTMELGEVIALLIADEDTTAEGGWSHSGVYLPEGTALRFSYLGQAFDGIVRDGLLVFPDAADESPSKVVLESIRARGHEVASVNGWVAILAEVAHGGGRRWQKLSELRLLAQESARRA